MKNKKIIIIFIVIIIILTIMGIRRNKENNDEFTRILGHTNEYYYSLVCKSGKWKTDCLNDFELHTFDKESKKTEKYKFDFLYKDLPVNLKEERVFSKWILTKSGDSRAIIGINTENGEVQVLLDELNENESFYSKEDYIINDFAMEGDNLIYSYNVGNEKSIVGVKNIENSKINEIARYPIEENIPVTIYGDNATYLIDNKVCIVDINTTNLIKETKPLYEGKVLLYKDKVYTFRIDDTTKVDFANKDFVKGLVELNFDGNENMILETSNKDCNLYIDGNKVIYDNYFYDTNNKKLYLSLLKNYMSNERIILDDYIYNQNKEYEELIIGKNYTEYPLKGDLRDGFSRIINSKEVVNILFNGEICITEEGSNKILRHYDGFNLNGLNGINDIDYSHKNIYGIEYSNNHDFGIVCINLENGQKTFVRGINEDKNKIKQLCVYNKEIGYLVKNQNYYEFIIFDKESNKENRYKLDIQEPLENILFNDNYIVTLDLQEKIIYIFDRQMGAMVKKEPTNIYSLIGITSEGFIVNNNMKYELLDFNLKKLKTFSDYNKVMKYMNK